MSDWDVVHWVEVHLYILCIFIILTVVYSTHCNSLDLDQIHVKCFGFSAYRESNDEFNANSVISWFRHSHTTVVLKLSLSRVIISNAVIRGRDMIYNPVINLVHLKHNMKKTCTLVPDRSFPVIPQCSTWVRNSNWLTTSIFHHPQISKEGNQPGWEYQCINCKKKWRTFEAARFTVKWNTMENNNDGKKNNNDGKKNNSNKTIMNKK